MELINDTNRNQNDIKYEKDKTVRKEVPPQQISLKTSQYDIKIQEKAFEQKTDNVYNFDYKNDNVDVIQCGDVNYII